MNPWDGPAGSSIAGGGPCAQPEKVRAMTRIGARAKVPFKRRFQKENLREDLSCASVHGRSSERLVYLLTAVFFDGLFEQGGRRRKLESKRRCVREYQLW